MSANIYNNNNNNNNNLLFIHTLLNLNRILKVQAVSSLRTSPHPSHLTRPHPYDVRRKDIILLSLIVGIYYHHHHHHHHCHFLISSSSEIIKFILQKNSQYGRKEPVS